MSTTTTEDTHLSEVVTRFAELGADAVVRAVRSDAPLDAVALARRIGQDVTAVDRRLHLLRVADELEAQTCSTTIADALAAGELDPDDDYWLEELLANDLARRDLLGYGVRVLRSAADKLPAALHLRDLDLLALGRAADAGDFDAVRALIKLLHVRADAWKFRELPELDGPQWLRCVQVITFCHPEAPLSSEYGTRRSTILGDERFAPFRPLVGR